MKTIFSLCLALLAVSTAHAQIFRPRPTTNAGPGRAEVNTSRGSDNVHRSHPEARGGDNRGHGYRDFGYGRRDFGYPRSGNRYYQGRIGLGYYGGPYGYGYFPSYSYYGGYGYGYPYYDTYGYYGSGNAATNGLLLGALAGGIIGNNSSDFRHNAWRGSAWGAGIGWLLGSVVDANRRQAAYATTPVVVQQVPAAQVQSPTAAPAQPQQVTIINNYYNASTPMSAANGMFGR